MRILLAPMGMPLATMGPAARLKTLAREGVARGHQVAVCAALDGNISPGDLPGEAAWMESPRPRTMGLPGPLARILPFLLHAMGLARRMKVKSFEQVLRLGGILAPDFFAADVQCLRQAIRDFRPDVVFSEYRLPAVAAAKLEGAPIVGTHSFPGRADYASSPGLSRGVRQWLAAQGLGPMRSILDLFELLDIRFVASSPDLEPFAEPVVHVGPLAPLPAPSAEHDGRPGKAVVFYMGNGAVSTSLLVKTARAMAGGPYELYVAAAGQRESHGPGLHVAERFDFSKLLPGAAAFVNHGGQNSIMQGLVCGAPQVMVPGNVFERDYNARSVARLGAGLRLTAEDFRPDRLEAAISELNASDARAKARQAGQTLTSLGGAKRVYEVLEERFTPAR